MRKQTKIAALVSAAALLAIGASMTSFAATWVGSDYDWTYVDRNGNAIEEAGWHRGNTEWGSNAQYYYYADDEGKMLFSQIIEGDGEDFYYVDDHGRRVTNTWVKDDAEDGEYPMADGTYVDTVDYFFGANGKAVRAKNTYDAFTLIQDNGYTTTGTFVFDKAGVMQKGKVEEVGSGKATYYCVQSDDYNFIGLDPEGTAWPYVTGQALNGWAKMDVEIMVDTLKESYDNVEWFYFDSCKLVKADGSKAIGGVNYTFDEQGVLGEWDGIHTATTSNSDPKEYNYKIYVDDNSTSTVGNKWVNFKDMDWYYILNTRQPDGNLIKKGVIFNYTYYGAGNSKNGTGASRLIKVGGKVYLIGADGVMKTGFQKVRKTEDVQVWLDDRTAGEGRAYWNGTNYEYYIPSTIKTPDDLYFYFDDSEDLDGDRGELKEGKITYEDEDGFTVTRLFQADGSTDTGYSVCENYLFYKGVLVTAEDSTYRAVRIQEAKVPKYSVKNGKVSKNTTGFNDDGNDYWVVVDRNGKIKRNSSRGLDLDDGYTYTISEYIVINREQTN